MMTELLRDIVSRIEQLPTTDQDKLAEFMRRELDAYDAERRRQIGLAALNRLAELTADLPPVDGVRVAQESRAELEQRSTS